MAGSNLKIGTAGWSMPRDVVQRLPPAQSALHRYATVFDTVEINSSFHRPHRPATYARWAAAVPDGFRFAVKLPKAITHDAGLIGAEAAIERFLEETAQLGRKRGPVLVQTPPKLVFDATIVAALAERLSAGGARQIAWEPRHPSWFEPDANSFLADHYIARVAADPAPDPRAAKPGGWREFAYHRLHGSPRIYYSGYDAASLTTIADASGGAQGGEVWIMFDNTASGEATRNARDLSRLVSRT